MTIWIIEKFSLVDDFRICSDKVTVQNELIKIYTDLLTKTK